MAAHTKRSPSQAKRFLSCAGALALEETLPPELRNQSGPAAQLGTATHHLIEVSLKDNKEPEAYAGRVIELVGDEENARMLRKSAKLPKRAICFEVDADMIEGATVMTNYVRGRMKEFPGASLQTESRTNPLPDRDDTSGTADVTIDAWPELLEVVDYKNGWNLVEHRDNDQLLAYLTGKAVETEFSHERYRVTVVQPNAPHEEGKVRPFEVTRAELLEFQNRYRVGIARCERAEAELASGCFPPGSKDFEAWASANLKAGEHCLFCDAQSICPAKRIQIEEEVQMDFAAKPEELTVPKSYPAISRALAWLPQLKAFAKAVEEAGLNALTAGFEVPDWKIVEGKSARKFRDDLDDDDLADQITDKFGVPRATLFTPPGKPELLTGPKIEKLIPAKRRKEFSEGFLIKPPGAPALAPADDPRPAMAISAEADFKDADGEDFG